MIMALTLIMNMIMIIAGAKRLQSGAAAAASPARTPRAIDPSRNIVIVTITIK